MEEKYGLKDMSTVKYADGIHVTKKDMEKIYKAYLLHNKMRYKM